LKPEIWEDGQLLVFLVLIFYFIYGLMHPTFENAAVVKLVYTPALGAGASRRESSSLSRGTAMQNPFFPAEINPELPEIDLHHTRSISDALDELESHLFQIQQDGAQFCRVIHGSGEGILAKATQEALTKNPLVLEWKLEETGGSCVVMF
jgi:hypothetical protein